MSQAGPAGSSCWLLVCARAGYTPEGGFFFDLGTGLAFDLPQATWTEEPDCLSGANQLFGSLGGGPVNAGVGQEWGDDESMQDGDGFIQLSLSLLPSEWKRLSLGAGGGFVHWFC